MHAGEREDAALIAESSHLLDALSGTSARLLGGVAVWQLCPSARVDPLARTYHDIDLAVTGPDVRALRRIVQNLGYVGREPFNAMQGASRLIYHRGAITLDVLVDRFEMCLDLDLRDRLRLSSRVVNPTDLLLTKWQIAELNWKDVLDLFSLLADLPLADVHGERVINVTRIAQLAGREWPWWAVLHDHHPRLVAFAATFPALAPRIEAALTRILQAVDDAPKSLSWKLRSRVGRKMPWYRIPDEVDR